MIAAPHDQAANTISSSNFSSSLLGEFTRVDIGHIRIASDGNDRSKSRGSGSEPSQRSKSPRCRIAGMRS
jgi:hypothetical protein